MKFKIIILISILLCLVGLNAENNNALINKRVKIVDGDTIHLNGNKYRLYGIDAPEIKQECEVNQKSYRCGLQSKNFLESIVKGKQIQCKQKGVDKYKRIVAICFVNGLDINQKMVKSGWAIAYRYYSMDYVEDELFAKNNQLGIWKGTFTKPKDWRRENR